MADGKMEKTGFRLFGLDFDTRERQEVKQSNSQSGRLMRDITCR